MKLNFRGDIEHVLRGVEILAEPFNYELSGDGVGVFVEKSAGGGLSACYDGECARIRYGGRKIHFFRALGLLLEGFNGGGAFEVCETPQFETCGVMQDVSQGGAVILPETYKEIFRRMAVMGLNMFMIYMEDGFVLPGEPFFGYMRPKYSCEDFKAIDDYADIFGIEVIPAIQTLAHLRDVLKWGCYYEEAESDDVLFVGEDKTYELIEKMLVASTEPFRTNRVHIGMDEAWTLGRFRYQDKRGIADRHSIMTEHLARVAKITEKLGLVPMIWSDMFFWTPNLQGYGNNYNPEAEISAETAANIPDSLSLVFWEYNSLTPSFYEKIIERHMSLKRNVLFAGIIWMHQGFGVNYGQTFNATNAALAACKNKGVKEVYATMWGDNSTENYFFSNLLGMQLYAEHAYAREVDENRLRARFAFCAGGNYDDFMSIRYLDEVPGVKDDNYKMANPSQYLLWQNVMMGLFDENIRGLGLSGHYAALGEKMGEAAKRNGSFNAVFELLGLLAKVLELKAELGVRITDHYLKGERRELAGYADGVIPELERRVRRLRDYHRQLWFKTNKPQGFEVIDYRYGALLTGLDTARSRVKDWCEGAVCSLDELAEARQPFPAGEGCLPAVYSYKFMASATRLHPESQIVF